MKTNVEAIAELSDTYGTVRVKGVKGSRNQPLGTSILLFENGDGNFSTQHQEGKITEVQYRVSNGPVIGPSREDKYFSIPFSKYIEWGRPKKISVKGEVTLSPLDS